MEIPLDLERRLERRWAARFFPTKRIALRRLHHPSAVPGKRKKPAVPPASECRRSMVWETSRSRGSFEQLDQRPRGERLREIGEAPGLKRSLASGGFVVSSHVDDRHRYARCFEPMPQFDP